MSWWWIIIVVALILFLIYLSECDRHFACRESFKNYYLIYPARAGLGIFNTLIRSTHHCPPQPSLSEHFPAHVEFAAQFDAIKKEALDVYERFQLPSFNQVDSFFDSIADDRWKTFIMLWYGDMMANCKYAPVTSALIAKHRDQIGAAMFSILQPGVRIPPHKGPCAAALRYHLCLQVPKRGTAKIRVDREWITYAEGGEYLFDDTYEHEVIVDAPPDDCVRIVLFMDIVRSMKQPLKGVADKIARNATFANFVKQVNANGEIKQQL